MAMLATEPQVYTIQDHDTILGELEVPYVLRFKDLPDTEKPREKLLAMGPHALSIAELVSVLWGVGSRKEDVLTMARRTLKEYGEKTLSHEQNPRRLAEATDVPLVKACQIIASFELGRRFYATEAGRPVQVRTATQAYQYVSDMGTSNKEQLRGLYLNSRYQLIHDEIISIGSLTSNVVHPREVFQPAIERHAAAIVLAHNHPSGSLEPTRADVDITKQLVVAGEVLGIELLDHLIITQDSFTSVMEYAKHE